MVRLDPACILDKTGSSGLVTAMCDGGTILLSVCLSIYGGIGWYTHRRVCAMDKVPVCM